MTEALHYKCREAVKSSFRPTVTPQCIRHNMALQDNKIVGVHSLIIASITQNPVNLRGLSPNDLP